MKTAAAILAVIILRLVHAGRWYWQHLVPRGGGTGAMVLVGLPVVPLTLVRALLMIVVSTLTPRPRPGPATRAASFAG